MPNICTICHRTSRKFKEIKFIPFPKKYHPRQQWLKSLKLTENDLKPSSRVCSFHFFGGERKKDDVPSINIGEKFGAKSTRVNVKNKIRQNEKTKVVVNDRQTSQINNSPATASTSGESNQQMEVGPSGDNITQQNVDLLAKINELEQKNKELAKQNMKLQEKSFSVTNFLSSDKDISYYTGFPTSKIFMSVFELVGNPTQYYGYLKKCLNENLGRKRLLDPLEEYFMYWFRLRHNIPEKVLADLFSVSIGTVNAILKTWCILINTVFTKLPIYPTMDEFNNVCPEKLKTLFPRCIAIYDCTEFYTEMPSKLDLQGVVWSEYYHHHTAKGLIGITLWGSVCFCSKLYPGGTSDPEIFRKSGAAELVKPGDRIMVDKGFLIDEDVVVRGGVVIRPAFKTANTHFNPQQVESSRKIASVRIYVEQAIKRIKAYRALNFLSISELKFASLHFQNAAIATNFQNSFVSATNPHNSDDKLEKLYAKFCEAVESIEEPTSESDTTDILSSLDQLIAENIVEIESVSTVPSSDVIGTCAPDVDEDLETTIGLIHLLCGDVSTEDNQTYELIE